MARYVYIRVSTAIQTYDRQIYELGKYFDRMGMTWNGVEIISEKITSHTRFTQRAIYPVLRKAKEGDIIYVCQLDRLGRTMIDILELVNYATERGVILMTIDNGYRLENKTAMGKLYLGMVSAMAEVERELRAERCQSGIDAARAELDAKGERTTKRGTKQIHWGNVKGTEKTKAIMEKARTSSIIANQEKAIRWKETSTAYLNALRKRGEGKTLEVIANEIGVMYDDFSATNPDLPNPYATPKGKKPSKGTISRWLANANTMM